MTIHINNDTSYPIDYDTIMYACKAALEADRCLRAEIGITLVTDTAIREMNKTYRGIDEVTDVLSFNVGDNPENILYGDIFICYGRAMRQAAEVGNTRKRELAFLTVHGTLHLLGYDHETEEDEEVMTAQQRKVMKSL